MARFSRFASLIACATALALAPVAAPAETVVTSAGDPAMAAAIATARSHLDRVFDEGFGDDGRAHPALTLKVAFPIETGEEIIWVAEVARSGAAFTGTLANAPLHLPELNAGDEVRFGEEMIADWGIVGAAGTLFGHYTTRVLIETMPEDQAGPIRALLNEDPLPAAWR